MYHVLVPVPLTVSSLFVLRLYARLGGLSAVAVAIAVIGSDRQKQAAHTAQASFVSHREPLAETGVLFIWS